MNVKFIYPIYLHRYESCKKFITDNTSFFVKKEEMVDEFAFGELTKIIDHSEVSPVKQGIFIEDFSIRKCREFHLNEETRIHIVASIFSKLANKSLVSSSLKFNNYGVVESVDGLIIDENGYVFLDEIKPPPEKRKRKKAIDSSENSENIRRNITFSCSRKLSALQKKISKY